MIFDLIRLHRQISRSKEISKKARDSVREQQKQEQAIQRSFKTQSELVDLSLLNCKKLRTSVIATLQENFAETRGYLENLGTSQKRYMVYSSSRKAYRTRAKV